MARIRILKTECNHIDEKEFREWLDSKNSEWRSSNFGLFKTGEEPEQDDESNVKTFIESKIEQFNMCGCVTSDGDVGCLNALCHMIQMYLEQKFLAQEEYRRELGRTDFILVTRK